MRRLTSLNRIQRRSGISPASIARPDFRVIALGTAIPVARFPKILSQNLGYRGPMQKYCGVVVETFVSGAAAFKKTLSASVCYGFVLQGLGEASLHNLLPHRSYAIGILDPKPLYPPPPWPAARPRCCLDA